MTKGLKTYILNIFIAISFLLSQVITVHANHLKNDAQWETISLIEQEKKNTVNIAALYVPNFTHEAKNESVIEGKFEKVFEPITLGFFSTMGALGFGFLTGSVMAIFSGIIGWAIGIIKGK
ncbi:cytochrome c-type biogenesis protein DsbD, protein-disulfide reductase [Bartonella kosoyi]|uniref:Cytochrome c-type biogenesis protein DsbD, protein-disulfide reductase n=1 Tax=Bartonella kosoyi TaxID=2133959 RepID=A0A5B9CW90_9HYPH|nr:hypothetical protein [Bartonella kosoyi]QEE08979.1 cytochrome c-type biogenesis protein DsbD, protein-disulfide reductase [Bartonella kosoyi]